MKRMIVIVVTAVFGMISISGCSGNSSATKAPDDPPVPVINKNVGLKHFASREEMQTFIKAKATEDMEASLDKKLKSSCRYVYSYDGWTDGVMVTPTADGQTQASQEISFTETNVQEQGVDEADTFKFDGSRAYVLHGDQLRIVQIWPLENFGELSTVDIEGTANSLYFYNNRVTVISTGITLISNRVTLDQDTYTKVTIVDVSTPSAPSIVRESYYEGDYKGSRRIDGDVYLVVYDRMVLPVADTNVNYELLPECGEDGLPKEAASAEAKAAVEELRVKNLAEIAKWEISEELFEAIKTKIGNDELKDIALDFDSFSASEVAQLGGVAGIIRIRTTDAAIADQKEYVIGNADTIYATKESIYLAGSEWGEEIKTYIHRFELNADEAKATYFGSNEVNGSLLNQFSLGEHNGYLRVVFSSNQSELNSTVAVIDAVDSNMPIVGTVGDIGKGEQVKAVRFVGDRGFVVTFRKIDPLFVIDLKEPTQPKVAGELKVPGFSTYLHPLDENHLIGLGRNVVDLGGFSEPGGLKLSIFDVSDSSAPKEDSSIDIGVSGTQSPASDDHLAFTYDSAKGLLSLPLTLCEGSDESGLFGNLTYDGVQLYDVSADTGFKFKSKLIDPTYSVTDGDNICHNWWNFQGSVQRTIIMGADSGNHVVTIEDDGLSIYKDNGEREKNLTWPMEEEYGPEIAY